MVIWLSRPAVVKWISAGQRAAVSRKADQTCPAKCMGFSGSAVGRGSSIACTKRSYYMTHAKAQAISNSN